MAAFDKASRSLMWEGMKGYFSDALPTVVGVISLVTAVALVAGIMTTITLLGGTDASVISFPKAWIYFSYGSSVLVGLLFLLLAVVFLWSIPEGLRARGETARNVKARAKELKQAATEIALIDKVEPPPQGN